jgi:hypothetical protein
VVLTVTVAVPGFTPARDTDVGEMAHVDRTGFPEQASETDPLKPLTGLRVRL